MPYTFKSAPFTVVTPNERANNSIPAGALVIDSVTRGLFVGSGAVDGLGVSATDDIFATSGNQIAEGIDISAASSWVGIENSAVGVPLLQARGAAGAIDIGLKAKGAANVYIGRGNSLKIVAGAFTDGATVAALTGKPDRTTAFSQADGTEFYYDSAKSLWLSMEQYSITFGYPGALADESEFDGPGGIAHSNAEPVTGQYTGGKGWVAPFKLMLSGISTAKTTGLFSDIVRIRSDVGWINQQITIPATGSSFTTMLLQNIVDKDENIWIIVKSLGSGSQDAYATLYYRRIAE